MSDRQAPRPEPDSPPELETWLGELIKEGQAATDWRSTYRTIDEQTDERLGKLLDNVSDSAIDGLISRIRRRREGLSLDSELTDKVLDICKQLLTFGAAGLSLAFAFFDKARELPAAAQKALAIGGLFYVELMLVSLLALSVYLLTARFRYAFLFFSKIGNAWPFFYYASVDPRLDIGLFRNLLVQPRAMIKNAALFAKDYLRLTERVTAETPRKKLRNELQQYATLMSYQAYVHQLSLHFTNIFLYGLVSAVISTVLLAVLVGLGIL